MQLPFFSQTLFSLPTQQSLDEAKDEIKKLREMATSAFAESKQQGIVDVQSK